MQFAIKILPHVWSPGLPQYPEKQQAWSLSAGTVFTTTWIAIRKALLAVTSLRSSGGICRSESRNGSKWSRVARLTVTTITYCDEGSCLTQSKTPFQSLRTCAWNGSSESALLIDVSLRALAFWSDVPEFCPLSVTRLMDVDAFEQGKKDGATSMLNGGPKKIHFPRTSSHNSTGRSSSDFTCSRNWIQVAVICRAVMQF